LSLFDRLQDPIAEICLQFTSRNATQRRPLTLEVVKELLAVDRLGKMPLDLRALIDG
jgi:hypothetical protein